MICTREHDFPQVLSHCYCGGALRAVKFDGSKVTVIRKDRPSVPMNEEVVRRFKERKSKKKLIKERIEIFRATNGTIRQVRQKLIEKALQEFCGNRTHAAQALGISIRGLRNSIFEYKLDTILNADNIETCSSPS